MVSSLSAFLGEIGRHQLLTPEQELMMGRKVQAMVAITERCHLAGGSGPACDYSDQEKVVIRRGERAKNQMITSNLRLVVNLAKRYQGKGLDLLDLIQEGTLGLTAPLKNTINPRTSLLPAWWIRQGLNRALSWSRTWDPVSVTKNSPNCAAKRMMQRNGLGPTTEQLSEFMAILRPMLKSARLRTASVTGACRGWSSRSDLELVMSCPAMNFPRWNVRRSPNITSVWTLLNKASLTERADGGDPAFGLDGTKSGAPWPVARHELLEGTCRRSCSGPAQLRKTGIRAASWNPPLKVEAAIANPRSAQEVNWRRSRGQSCGRDGGCRCGGQRGDR